MTNSSAPTARKEAAVDVVIVQYGSYPFLSKCLQSLEAGSTVPNRIIVVVNGIRDAPVEQIQRDHPSVEVVLNSVNAGYSRAANQGLRLSKAKYVVLLNNDLTVDPNWLTPLREAADRDPTAALIQPKVLSSLDPHQFDYAGAAGGFIDGYGYPCARGRVFDSIEEDHGQYDDPCELFWASGAALMIDREAALRIGGFDEDFFIFHEESDLAWRLHMQGRRVRFCPESRVYHFGSGSFKASQSATRLQFYMMHRNDLLMVIKNWGTRELRFRLPVRVLLEVVSWPFLVARGTHEFSEAVKGFAWVVGNPRKVAAMRRKAQSERTHPDSSFRHLMVRGILPLRYFLGRAKAFPKLDRYPST
ncbi:MAG: glycosyltransferase family 2 protein [Thermoplasmata archaeon]